MTRTLLNAGWSVRRKVTAFQELGGSDSGQWTDVVLPHDALLGTERRADAQDGHTNGYHSGGAWEYRHLLDAPAEQAGKLVFLEFDGVYRDAVVTVNGAYAGRWSNGYSRFVIRIDPFLRFGQENEIRVACRTHLDSRWYAGAGIHRDVHLLVKEPVHLAVDGTRVTTPVVEDGMAEVEVAVEVENSGPVTTRSRVSAVLRGSDGREVAQRTSPITLQPGERGTARLRMVVDQPRLWSADAPELYEARVVLADEAGGVLDAESVRVGIRTLRVDAARGLRVNGVPVKLRGACIHSDNGPLGAAAIRAAEYRKIELLKAAGFNAIRSAHNASSSALLDACDRLGMYVMDETFDMWTQGKNDFDYSADFPLWWERDLEALVAKDINHPSVIFYSIGNEIPETGTPDGGRWGRRMAEKLRELDPTRLVTNGINGFVSALDVVLSSLQERRREAGEDPQEVAGGVNGMMNSFGAMMGQIAASPIVTEATEESFAVLDVAGLNYGESRYVLDRELFPDRVIVGTETWPTVMDRNWALVTEHPHVIGDFTWTGLDYLGENGIGVVGYADDPSGRSGFATPYPGLTANCGDLDITGHRRPQSYYREIVFGLRTAPYIAVQRPDRYDATISIGTPWSWSDTVASWTWRGFEGARVRVEVYAPADEVELRLDGNVIGREPVGTERAFRADFDVTYQPGELSAVSFVDGVAVDRTTLRSAVGEPGLRIAAAPALVDDTSDLAFLTLTIADEQGNVSCGDDRVVQVEVRGAGVLQALGSGAPVTAESFLSSRHSTFDGRLLAVVRPTGPGEIVVTAVIDGQPPVTTTITVAAQTGDVDADAFV